VLEDHVLARQRVKRSQRPFSHELAEMVRYAVGYRSRAFVTFGTPIDVSGVDPNSRRAVLDLTHAVMQTIGASTRSAADGRRSAMRPSITRRDSSNAPTPSSTTLRSCDANLGVESGEEAVDAALEPLEARGSSCQPGTRSRSQSQRAALLRPARSTICSSLPPGLTTRGTRRVADVHSPVAKHTLKRLASAYGMATPTSFRQALHRRRDRSTMRLRRRARCRRRDCG
jgi:hypothetical protein